MQNLPLRLVDLDNRFAAESAVGSLVGIDRSKRASGLGVSLETDTRDNLFTPSRGWTGALDATFYDPRWGSDTSFQSYRALRPVSKLAIVWRVGMAVYGSS